jgi:hypothetical protein
MGFGKKTDYPTGRILDLDKSYRNIIKPAAKAAGYDCTRADEIQHAGNINVPMYEQLLTADVVIADVSTYNPNAFYELGVRHALKPYTTITIAEDKLEFPFDIKQNAIRKYHHLGEGIDSEEVDRMRSELRDAIEIVGRKATCDSPVYTFLHDLLPPSLKKKAQARSVAFAAPKAEPASQLTVRTLMDQTEAAFQRDDFVTARSLLAVVRTMLPTDAYVAQRLALATYKSKLPTPDAALQDAAEIIESLKPATSTDSETLGLYGAVHKRFWELSGTAEHLETAIWAHEKGFYIRNDHYNGINLAFLLNVRAKLRRAAERTGRGHRRFRHCAANASPRAGILPGTARFVPAARPRPGVLDQSDDGRSVHRPRRQREGAGNLESGASGAWRRSLDDRDCRGSACQTSKVTG